MKKDKVNIGYEAERLYSLINEQLLKEYATTIHFYFHSNFGLCFVNIKYEFSNATYLYSNTYTKADLKQCIEDIKTALERLK